MDKNINRKFVSISTKLTRYFMVIILAFILVMNLIFFINFVMEVKDYNKTSFINQGQLVSENLGKAFEEEFRSLVDIQHKNGSETNRHSPGMMGKSITYNRIEAIIKGINASSIYLLDLNNNVISENKPEMDISNLLKSYDKTLVFHREEKRIFAYRDQLIAPILIDGVKIYSIVMESPEYTIGSALGRVAPILLISSILGAITSYLISKVLLKRVSKPIITITETTKEYRKGDYSRKTNISQNDELGELSLSIDSFSTELEEARLMKEAEINNQREFIATISHELRTPISIMKLSVEALGNLNLEDLRTKEYLNALKNESDHLQLLVNDLIELTKLENTNFKIEISKLNLVDVINDAIRSMKISAKDKNIIISQELPNLIEVNGDYGRLRQLFSIILDNSIKYSHYNGIIEVFFENGIIKIKDYGLGISEQNLKKVFERYYRVNDNVESGSGLGLAIAREIALRHGFELIVDSVLNDFTQFSLKL